MGLGSFRVAAAGVSGGIVDRAEPDVADGKPRKMPGSFQDQIAANRRNSAWLVVLFIILVGIVVFLFGVAFAGGSARAGLGAAAIGLAVAGLVAIWGTFGGASAILATEPGAEDRQAGRPAALERRRGDLDRGGAPRCRRSTRSTTRR